MLLRIIISWVILTQISVCKVSRCLIVVIEANIDRRDRVKKWRTTTTCCLFIRRLELTRLNVAASQLTLLVNLAAPSCISVALVHRLRATCGMHISAPHMGLSCIFIVYQVMILVKEFLS